MADYTTKELFDLYFNQMDKSEEYKKKIRAQIDRPEVIEFEIKNKKSIIDLTPEEFLDLISSFKNNRVGKIGSHNISVGTFTAIASQYRSFFNWYIDNIKVIKNPFNNPILKGVNAYEKLHTEHDVFTINDFNRILKMIRSDYESDRADYIECIMRMFFDGFYNAEEIVMLKESMINFRQLTVTLPGRTVNISARTAELLRRIHGMEEISGWRAKLVMESWHDGYFKYHIREKEREIFQEREKFKIANMVNFEILKYVKDKYSINVGYRTFYVLGFYEYLKSLYGEERTKQIICSVRDPESTLDLINAGRMYGVNNLDNVSLIKKMLLPFVPN